MARTFRTQELIREGKNVVEFAIKSKGRVDFFIRQSAGSISVRRPRQRTWSRIALNDIVRLADEKGQSMVGLRGRASPNYPVRGATQQSPLTAE